MIINLIAHIIAEQSFFRKFFTRSYHKQVINFEMTRLRHGNDDPKREL